MGYHLTTSLDLPPARSHASPKTHTPLPRLQERGLRYYSPEVGRWVNRDPIGERGGSCIYSALDNSPVNKVDPFGREVWSFIENQLPWRDEYAVDPEYPRFRVRGKTFDAPVDVRINTTIDPASILLPWRIETTSGRLVIDFYFKDRAAEVHERLHVADFRSHIFEATKKYVTDKEGFRFCRYEQAACWKRVCESTATKTFHLCGLAWTYAYVDLPYAISRGDAGLWAQYLELTRIARQRCEAARRELSAAETGCRDL
jgi:RHS repeat-associated protein